MQISPLHSTSFGMAYRHEGSHIDDTVKSLTEAKKLQAYEKYAGKLNWHSNRKKMDVVLAKSGDSFELRIVDKKGREIKAEPHQVTMDLLTNKKEFCKLHKTIKKEMVEEFKRLKSLDAIMKKHGYENSRKG